MKKITTILSLLALALSMAGTEAGVQMRFTRCGFYDMAKHLGITEEAFYMVCASDPYITEGFNSNIGFKRTKTLMQGHDCCDHFYYIKSKENE